MERTHAQAHHPPSSFTSLQSLAESGKIHIINGCEEVTCHAAFFYVLILLSDVYVCVSGDVRNSFQCELLCYALLLKGNELSSAVCCNAATTVAVANAVVYVR